MKSIQVLSASLKLCLSGYKATINNMELSSLLRGLTCWVRMVGRSQDACQSGLRRGRSSPLPSGSSDWRLMKTKEQNMTVLTSLSQCEKWHVCLSVCLSHTERIHVSQLLLVLGTRGCLLSRALPLDLGRGLVAVWQAEGGVGPLHGARVNGSGTAVNGCGAGLTGSNGADGVRQASARRAQCG